MRARTAVLLVLAALLSGVSAGVSPAAHASDVLLAQATDEDEGGDEGADADEGSGSTESEVGADEGQTESTEAEAGPPWTYQMARMVLALLVLIAVAIGVLYWRLVVQRQRRGI